MLKKKINERLQYFSIFLNVRKKKNVNWQLLTDNKIIKNIIKLKFLTSMDSKTFFKNFEGIAQNLNVDKLKVN